MQGPDVDQVDANTQPDGRGSLAARYAERCYSQPTRLAFGLKLAGTWWWVPHGEFLSMVEGLRGGLVDLGVAPGDTVAIFAANRLEWLVACYAAWGCGAVVVPVDVSRPQIEFTHILRDSRARVAIVDENTSSSTIRQLRADAPGLVQVVSVAAPTPEGAVAYQAVLEAGSRRPTPIHSTDDSAAAVWLYVTDHGALGRGTELSHGDVVAAANALASRLGLCADERVLPVVPWTWHIAALHAFAMNGYTILIDDGESSLPTLLLEAEPNGVCATAATLARWHDQLTAIGYFGKRCLAAAAARRQGQPLSRLDDRLLRLTDRILPPTRLGPFGGPALADDHGPAAVDLAFLERALGVRVHALEPASGCTAEHDGSTRVSD